MTESNRYTDELDRGQGTTADFSVSTLEEEAIGHGWTRITMPGGGKNGPAAAITAGMRGDPDADDDSGVVKDRY